MEFQGSDNYCAYFGIEFFIISPSQEFYMAGSANGQPQ